MCGWALAVAEVVEVEVRLWVSGRGKRKIDSIREGLGRRGKENECSGKVNVGGRRLVGVVVEE